MKLPKLSSGSVPFLRHISVKRRSLEKKGRTGLLKKAPGPLGSIRSLPLLTI
jgi:hypothetical protein